MPSDFFLPMGFSFSVSIQDGDGDATRYDFKESDGTFQSVAGLSVDLEMEEIAEGGENRFKHKLPVKTKYPNLVLKRGFFLESKVTEWFKDGIQTFKIVPKTIIVTLMKPGEKNDDGTTKLVPLYSWNIVGAYPIKWNVDTFNAEESKIVLETIEFAYNYFDAKKA